MDPSRRSLLSSSPARTQFLKSRRKSPSPPLRSKAPAWRDRALYLHTGDGRLQVVSKSELDKCKYFPILSIDHINHFDVASDSSYVKVDLPPGEKEVLLFYDWQTRSDVKAESQLETHSSTNDTAGKLKLYLPFVTLYLDRLDLVNRGLLHFGKLNTLYVERTGVLDDNVVTPVEAH